LQRALPWLALLWPLAVAVLVFLVGRVVLGRRRAERDFELTFNLSRDLMCIAGVDGYYKRVNPAFGDALGYPPGELLSSPMDRFVHPDDHERMHEAIGRLSRGEEVAQFESRAVRADGAVRWLEWSARSVAAEGLIYAVARDVTDRRQTERELELLAREQAALRRVATLVARDASPADVLDAVVAEVRALLGSDATRLLRYDDDDTCVVVANNSDPGTEIPVGTRVPLEGDNIPGLIRRSRKTLRQHGLEGAAGPLAARARSMGVEVAAGAPVSVEGRLWGVMVAIWTRRVPLGIETEGRMEQFTDLVAVAIANAESRTQLVASRARVVTAADETRRRIERDLHDATQQRLVSLALELRATEASIPESMPEIRAQLAETASGLGEVLDEVQEISRGIHPVILSTSGLGPALRTLARRSAVPVELDVHLDGRLPLPVEVASYHVVSEALTNAAKHASATVVHVGVQSHDSIVDLEVRDDGVGGASPARGSGLVGLRDRVEALAGTIDIESAPGHGTALSVRIPIVDDLS
jgi:PAS domain S-box-containing protein